MNNAARVRRSPQGFSFVELLVTIVLAGIIFAAMVPVFAGALKKSAADGFRVTATNIAQDRIEQIRLLNYEVVTSSPDNLNHPPTSDFGDGRFGHTYALAGSSRPYYIDYVVGEQTKHKKVTVQVKWSDSDYVTTMNTIIVDPADEEIVTSSGNPAPTNTPLPSMGPFKITVSFKNWTYVYQSSSGKTPKGVTLKRTAPSAGQVQAILYPSAGSPKVSWTGVPGGTDITYTVTCATSNGTFTTPPFHLLSDTPIHFDTNPGGS